MDAPPWNEKAFSNAAATGHLGELKYKNNRMVTLGDEDSFMDIP
jgi:hypothetical protein